MDLQKNVHKRVQKDQECHKDGLKLMLSWFWFDFELKNSQKNVEKETKNGSEEESKDALH